MWPCSGCRAQKLKKIFKSQFGEERIYVDIHDVLDAQGFAMHHRVTVLTAEQKDELTVDTVGYQRIPILPSLHNRTHSKVEAWARWSARPKICLIVTIGLQQSG